MDAGLNSCYLKMDLNAVVLIKHSQNPHLGREFFFCLFMNIYVNLISEKGRAINKTKNRHIYRTDINNIIYLYFALESNKQLLLQSLTA